MLAYKTMNVPDLQDCDISASFCLTVNDMGDAMNSKTPATGLKPGGHEWKVGQGSLKAPATQSGDLIYKNETNNMFSVN